MKKKKKQSIRERKLYRQRLYDLGWMEDDNDVWRCASCKTPKMYIDCGMCGRCEGCYKCEPDTDAGKQAVRDYIEKGKATIDFDIFGEPLE